MTDLVPIDGIHDRYMRTAEPVRTPGGTARLYEIHGDPELLYKEFPQPLAGGHPERLEELAEVGQMTAEDRSLSAPMYRVGWPLDVELAGGEAHGVVIRRAGRQFHRPDEGLIQIAQSFGHLMMDPLPPATVRLTVVRQLAGVLRVLHGHDLVHGDISASNVLWSADPGVDLLLIDSDGMYEVGFPAHRAYTPTWDDPRLQARLIERHDQESDWYALALAAYRAIVLDRRADPVGDLADEVSWAAIPVALQQPLLKAFTSPLDEGSRVSPAVWEDVLAETAEDADLCAAIDRAFAGPRGAAPSPRRSWDTPRRPAPSSSRPRAPRVGGSPREPRPAWAMRAAMAIVLVLVGLMLLGRLGG